MCDVGAYMDQVIIPIILGIVVLLTTAVLVVAGKFNQEKTQRQYLETKYSGIIDIDKEIDDANESKNKIIGEIKTLKDKYEFASGEFEKLSHEVGLLKDDLDISEYGIYEPHFEFDDSERFKTAILNCKEKQKEMVKSKDAILGGDDWKVNGSVSEGKKMITKQKKIMMRAFNGESDVFIASCNWNNVERLRARMNKAFETINKTGESHGIFISHKYLDLKLQQLELTYEYKLKRQEEKDEQRRIREQMREEEKAQREYEKAIKAAEKEEKIAHNAYEKAKAELEQASDEQKAKFEQKLKALEAKLKEAEENGKRALSMAQQTKAGHVYIISNIGSFGEDVYKIGMTRRLEPLDRVRELGDASVPFKFDVHAMIYSEDAPELENKLHKHFSEKRLNLINLRREFFDVELEEIENFVAQNCDSVEFIKIPEAEEYRESLAIKKKANSQEPDVVNEAEPKFAKSEELFA